MRFIVLLGTSVSLCLSLVACESNTTNVPLSEPVSAQHGDSVSYSKGKFLPSSGKDTVIIPYPPDDSLEEDVSSHLQLQTEVKSQNPSVSSPQKDPRKFTRITERIADSLRATPGAALRLHPDDYALVSLYLSRHKQLMPKKDPKTGDYLPFPYAYPLRYGAEIRSLDSIKAAEAQKNTAPSTKDSIPKPQR